jgi:hypothetical protein
MLEALTPQLFAGARGTRAFILFGASASKPREAYELVFPPCPEEQLEDVNVDQLCRLARRELVLHCAGQPDGTAPQSRCKVFFVVEGSPGAAAPPPSFAIKRGWRLRMTKGLQVCMAFNAKGAGAEEGEPTAGAAPSPADHRSGLWFQCKRVPQGLMKAS